MLFKSQTLAKQTKENSRRGKKDVYRKSWVDKERKALFFCVCFGEKQKFCIDILWQIDSGRLQQNKIKMLQVNLHVHKRVAFTYGTRSNVYSCNAAASWATHIYIRWFIAYIWHLFAFNVFYIESFVFDFKYTRSFRRHLKCTNIKLSWTECSTVFMLFLFFPCFFVRRVWIWIKLRFLSLYERNDLCHWNSVQRIASHQRFDLLGIAK